MPGAPISAMPIPDSLWSIFDCQPRDALAGFQLNLDLQLLRFPSEFRALIDVPGDRRGRSIARFVIWRGADQQAVFARRDIAERERAVAANKRFGVTQYFISRVQLSRDHMDAKSFRRCRVCVFRNDLSPQTRRAVRNSHRNASQFFSLSERKSAARNTAVSRR